MCITIISKILSAAKQIVECVLLFWEYVYYYVVTLILFLKHYMLYIRSVYLLSILTAKNDPWKPLNSTVNADSQSKKGRQANPLLTLVKQHTLDCACLLPCQMMFSHKLLSAECHATCSLYCMLLCGSWAFVGHWLLICRAQCLI